MARSLITERTLMLARSRLQVIRGAVRRLCEGSLPLVRAAASCIVAAALFACANDVDRPIPEHVAWTDGQVEPEAFQASSEDRVVDSVVFVIDALEDSLRDFAGDPRIEDWLWQAGTLWSDNLRESGQWRGPDWKRQLSRYPQYFKREHFYNFYHFKKLMELFPSSELVERAAYAIVDERQWRDCEISVACQIEGDLLGPSRFLERYPHSAYVESAVVKANDAFLQSLTGKWKLRVDYDSAQVRSLVLKYQILSDTLPPSAQVLAYKVIGPLWEAFGDSLRARRVYDGLLTKLNAHVDTVTLRAEWNALVQALRDPADYPEQ